MMDNDGWVARHWADGVGIVVQFDRGLWWLYLAVGGWWLNGMFGVCFIRFPVVVCHSDLC